MSDETLFLQLTKREFLITCKQMLLTVALGLFEPQIQKELFQFLVKVYEVCEAQRPEFLEGIKPQLEAFRDEAEKTIQALEEAEKEE